MNRICYIYGLFDSHNKAYIGVSINPELRFKNHLYNAKNKSSKEYNLRKSRWIRKYENDIKLKILYQGVEPECYHKEPDFINEYKLNGYVIQNIAQGGYKPPAINTLPNFDEIKIKIRNKALGKKATDETKRKMSEARTGRRGSEKQRDAVIQYNKNRAKEAEWINRVIKRRKEKRKKIKKHQFERSQTAIIRSEYLVLDLYTGIFYESIGAAALALNIKRNTMKGYVTGKRKNKTNCIHV